MEQAGAMEFHRDSYDCWVHRKSGKCVPPLEGISLDYGDGAIRRLLAASHLYYIRLQYLVSEADDDLIRKERALRNRPDRERISQTYRSRALPTVRMWMWMSSNKRTIALTVCCLLKLPILFFLYEVVLLNGLMLWMKGVQRRTNLKLRESLSPCAD